MSRHFLTQTDMLTPHLVKIPICVIKNNNDLTGYAHFNPKFPVDNFATKRNRVTSAYRVGRHAQTGVQVLSCKPGDDILAIDPGINGAYAVFTPGGRLLKADDLPRFSNGLDTMSVANLFQTHRPSWIMIEREASRPGQGVSSMFGFGFACGVIAGCAACSGAPVHYVSPNMWKKHFRLIGKPKDASRELASRLYPEFRGLSRVKDHNRAEAILIGRYALDTASRPPAVEPAPELEDELII